MLAHHEGGVSGKDKRSGKARVASPKSARPSAAIEQSLLNGRRRPGLPEMVEICENESMLCVVRAYIEGQPLDQAAREKPFTEKQAVGIITQLCETLIFLHAQQPSIIHRDIKPQNIIVDTEGNAVLIDFGIARAYAPEARADTVCFGTRHFAAPEQYGFSQTDARTDIYALGVLLGWLLTGESDIEAIRKKMPNGRLKAVALKCAAFDPCERYKNAAQVRDALSGRTRRRALLGALIAVGVVAASLFALSSAGYLPARQSERVRFTEPLIEQAARAALEQPPGAPLTEDDLLGVTDVLVMGDQAAADEDAYRALVDRFAVNDPAIQRGGIASLEDLALMPNLRRVWLAFQNISDISALAGLRYLEHVDLKHNPLEDISPLAGSTALEFLTLYDTWVKDFAALNCFRAGGADIGKRRSATFRPAGLAPPRAALGSLARDRWKRCARCRY